MNTPRLTVHARERCVEMGISTKVAKRIVQNPSMVLPDFGGDDDRQFVRSMTEPDYVVVLDAKRHMVVTVLRWSPERIFSREAVTT